MCPPVPGGVPAQESWSRKDLSQQLSGGHALWGCYEGSEDAHARGGFKRGCEVAGWQGQGFPSGRGRGSDPVGMVSVNPHSPPMGWSGNPTLPMSVPRLSEVE